VADTRMGIGPAEGCRHLGMAVVGAALAGWKRKFEEGSGGDRGPKSLAGGPMCQQAEDHSTAPVEVVDPVRPQTEPRAPAPTPQEQAAEQVDDLDPRRYMGDMARQDAHALPSEEAPFWAPPPGFPETLVVPRSSDPASPSVDLRSSHPALC